MNITSRRVLLLCAEAEHYIDSFPHSQDDPGADICMSEVCSSVELVGLYDGLAHATRWLDVLDCRCVSPQVCDCTIEMVRYGVEKVRLRAELEFGILCREGVVDEDKAKAICAGVPQGHCDLHVLLPLPCPWCAEVWPSEAAQEVAS